MAIAAPTALAEQEMPTTPPATPSAPAPSFEDRLIVEWVAGASRADRAEAREEADVSFASDLGNRRFQLVELQPGQAADDAIASLEGDPSVVLAEPDGYSVPHGVPNDPLFGQLWGLRNPGLGISGFVGALPGADIGAPAAWNRAVGLPSTVVAVIDSGYRFDSPDLGPVAWSNPADPSDGSDNDSNGIVDDSHGADFVGVSANITVTDGDPTEDNLIDGGHGAHTAGTVGAAGNDGIGVTGVARNVRIMPLRACGYFTDPTPTPTDDSGTICPFSSQILAINYAGSHGARAANMSLGGTSANLAVRDAIAANPHVLFVISAGNDSDNNDSVPHYPCNFNPLAEGKSAVDNVVCVAATNQADGLAGFSDWGATSVDLGAPGTETLSVYPGQEVSFHESFELNDFSAKWSKTGTNGFGRASSGDGPLASFGMNDSPGAAPTPGASYDTTLTTGVAIPPGVGACTLSGKRYRNGGIGGTFYYQVLSDGSSAFLNTGSAVTPTFAMTSFNTVPITGLGGHSVKLRFGFTAGGGTQEPNYGIWFDDLDITCNKPLSSPPGYTFLQGTSMAAPHVTGTAALLFSLKPTASVTQVRQALLGSVDPLASLSGKTTTGGRLDSAAALDALVPVGAETVAPDTAILSGPAGTVPDTSAAFSFVRTDADAGAFECQLDGAAFSPCTSPATYSVAPGSHQFQVRAKVPSGLVDPTPAAHSWSVSEPTVSPTNTPGPSSSSVAPPRPCKVPKLAGLRLGQAEAALRAAGCELGKVAKPKPRKGRKRTALVVKSSTPAAGSSTTGKVDLILGPKPKPKKRRH